MHSGENLPRVDFVLGTMSFPVIEWAACLESLGNRV